MNAAKKQPSVTEYVGLNEAAKKFIRRHKEVKSDATTLGIFDEEVRLGKWQHNHKGSHMKYLHETVQTKPVIGNRMYVFTYLEAEYACGAREPMFMWHDGADDGNHTFDRKRGLVFI